ncbi:MAG TPA: hypothetical protein VFW00_13935 [Rhodocyclaceae bacterium]|nr:hypothetical protein [Rhodocyclaceae bacterium]
MQKPFAALASWAVISGTREDGLQQAPIDDPAPNQVPLPIEQEEDSHATEKTSNRIEYELCLRHTEFNPFRIVPYW